MTALQEEIRAAIEPLLIPLREELAALRKAAPERMLTTEEAADILGVSVQTVRRKVKAGQLPCVRLGGQMRFRRDDLA